MLLHMPVVTPKPIAQAVVQEIKGTVVVFEKVLSDGILPRPEEIDAGVICPSREGTLLNLYQSPGGQVLIHSLVCASGCEHLGEGCKAGLPEGVPPTHRQL